MTQSMTVGELGRVYVKATRFTHPDEVWIDPDGIRHDRRFAMVEADDSFIASARHGDFFGLSFDFDEAADRLTLTLPDGRVIEGPAAGAGEGWEHNHFTVHAWRVREVAGPWAETLSAYAGRPIRLVRCEGPGAGIDILPVTFVTTGSLARLSRELGAPVQAARFRPGLVLNHAAEHAEDDWAGRRLAVGEAVLEVVTPVPRCQITGMNPLTGETDLEVMKALIRYREKSAYPDGLLQGYETPGFATYARVLRPGRVRVGDAARLLD